MTRTVKTSETSPLRVAWLPPIFSGALGITIAPGKHSVSTEGFLWRRDLDADLRQLAQDKVALLVCLLEDHEMHRLGIADLRIRAQEHGIQVHRAPIPDRGVPQNLRRLAKAIARIEETAQAGGNVVIHCNGGVGRSGLLAGAVLVTQGKSLEETFELLKAARGEHCPETEAQRALIAHVASRENPRPESPSARQLKIEGCVLGAAIGDAMGHPTEFMSMSQIHAKYGPEGVTDFALFWEKDGAKFAPYTDDTQMAEAVLGALLESRAQDARLDETMRRIAQRFIVWAEAPQGGHRAPGGACLAGSRALAQGAPWTESGGAEAGGCGSVMRAYPFGLLFADDLERAEAWAVAHSKLTHRDPIALAACAAMAVGVALALHDARPETVAEVMISSAARYCETTAAMMRQAKAEAEDGTPPGVTLDRLQAWAAHEAIAAGLYIFLRHPNDPRAAILEGANTPGDSDSIATLAGALVGARAGIQALPQRWVAQVERSGQLLELARIAYSA